MSISPIYGLKRSVAADANWKACALSLDLNCAILSAQNKTVTGENEMLKRILFGGESGLSVPANAGLTLLRIFAGVALLMSHGMGKVPPSDQFIAGTANLGFPIPTFFAWAAALSESLGGALLALGFLTRPAAFFIAFTMGTALLGVHRADPFAKQELAFLYFFIAFAHLIMGAGDWSIDRFLRK